MKTVHALLLGVFLISPPLIAQNDGDLLGPVESLKSGHSGAGNGQDYRHKMLTYGKSLAIQILRSTDPEDIQQLPNLSKAAKDLFVKHYSDDPEKYTLLQKLSQIDPEPLDRDESSVPGIDAYSQSNSSTVPVLFPNADGTQRDRYSVAESLIHEAFHLAENHQGKEHHPGGVLEKEITQISHALVYELAEQLYANHTDKTIIKTVKMQTSQWTFEHQNFVYKRTNVNNWVWEFRKILRQIARKLEGVEYQGVDWFWADRDKNTKTIDGVFKIYVPTPESIDRYRRKKNKVLITVDWTNGCNYYWKGFGWYRTYLEEMLQDLGKPITPEFSVLNDYNIWSVMDPECDKKTHAKRMGALLVELVYYTWEKIPIVSTLIK